MIHFTYRHFQRDYSCRVHGTLSVSHWLLWQARAPHRRIAPASASCDANLSMAILSHGTDGCQYITSILLISVYPFMICIFRSPRSRSPRLNAARQTNRINAPRKWCFWRWPSARQRAFSPALRVPSCSSVSPALSIKQQTDGLMAVRLSVFALIFPDARPSEKGKPFCPVRPSPLVWRSRSACRRTVVRANHSLSRVT